PRFARCDRLVSGYAKAHGALRRLHELCTDPRMQAELAGQVEGGNGLVQLEAEDRFVPDVVGESDVGHASGEAEGVIERKQPVEVAYGRDVERHASGERASSTMERRRLGA